jgi:heterotetrameric sarcosine oxidase gamma subunit
VPDRLIISPYHAPNLAIIQARKHVSAARIGEALGCVAPIGPGRSSGADLALIGTGPGTWFAIGEAGADGWIEHLETHLAGLAFVTDQSAGYQVLRLSGEKARALLQRGVSVDLHPDRFPAGMSASTLIAHIAALTWLEEDGRSFGLAYYRSYEASMRAWIESTAAAL